MYLQQEIVNSWGLVCVGGLYSYIESGVTEYETITKYDQSADYNGNAFIMYNDMNLTWKECGKLFKEKSVCVGLRKGEKLIAPG